MAVKPVSSSPTSPSKDIGEIISSVKGGSAAPITEQQAIKILAGAVEDRISYAQAQSALRDAKFTGRASLGFEVHQQVEGDTREAQTSLKQLGLLHGVGAVDGKLGPATATAIVAFQKSCKPPLAPTGHLDPATKAALGKMRDADNVSWAQVSLPEQQHHYDELTKGKTHLGFSQQDIARMTPEFAAKNGIDEPIRAAAHQVALLESHLPGAERGSSRDLAALRSMRGVEDFVKSFTTPAAAALGSITMPTALITAK